jgi:flagellar hook protein FlgE
MFSLERDGQLVLPSNGLVVQGWKANNSSIDNTAQLTGVTLPVGQTIPPITTSNVEFKYNLDSRNNGSLALGPNPQTILDSSNNSSRLTFTLEPTGNFNEFTYTATVADGTITDALGTNLLNSDGTAQKTVTGRLVMNSDGTVQSITGTDFYIKSQAAGAAAVRIGVPTVGATANFAANQTRTSVGTPTIAGGVVTAVSYPASTITDIAGKSATVNYTFTATATPGVFNWTATATGGTIPAGSGSGTITFDATGAVTAVTGSDFTVTPSGSTTAFQVSLPTVGGTNQFTYRTCGETFKATYTDPTNPAVTSRVIDSLGQAHTVYTTFTKTDNNSWDWVAKDETGNTTYGNGSVAFGSDGKIASSIGGPIVINTSGAQPISIAPDFNSLTQYASETDIASASNGYPMGQLESFNIDSSGKIIGVFSNGLTETLAQVAMASFRNPSGLTRAGDTMFSESNNSGTAQVGSAGTNGRGEITPGALEMSNVDLSQEFTDMITTERGFQANSKIITTSDEMLQDLVNLKR